MYFVYYEGLTRIDVLGGTMTMQAGKQLAEDRAKKDLEWVGDEVSAEAPDYQGKTVLKYKVKRREEG